jgi:hypothetical protein
MLDTFIASQGMPEDDASEIRAISLALSRSITRRAQVGFMSMFMNNSSVCNNLQQNVAENLPTILPLSQTLFSFFCPA